MSIHRRNNRSLKELQQDFIVGLTAPVVDQSYAQNFQAMNQAVEESFSIYRNNHRGSLIKALKTTYPVCQQLVGDPFFRALARQYIAEYPSTVTNLNDYGASFANMLGCCPHVSYLSYLPAVAELEWIIHQVTLGVEEPPFDWELLSNIPPKQQEHLVLHRPQHSISYQAHYPVDRIWETNQPQFSGDEIVDLGEGGVYLFIWRHHFDLRIDRLTKAQWSLLTIIDGRLSLGQLLNAPVVIEQRLDVLALLPTLIKKGYIARFSG
jgi:hypothetical protein